MLSQTTELDEEGYFLPILLPTAPHSSSELVPPLFRPKLCPWRQVFSIGTVPAYQPISLHCFSSIQNTGTVPILKSFHCYCCGSVQCTAGRLCLTVVQAQWNPVRVQQLPWPWDDLGWAVWGTWWILWQVCILEINYIHLSYRYCEICILFCVIILVFERLFILLFCYLFHNYHNYYY